MTYVPVQDYAKQLTAAASTKVHTPTQPQTQQLTTNSVQVQTDKKPFDYNDENGKLLLQQTYQAPYAYAQWEHVRTLWSL